MMYWSLIFLALALVAALLGLGALIAAGIAKVLLAAFAVLFLASFLAHLTQTRPQ